MTQIPICLECGNNILEIVFINDTEYYFCWVCEDRDEMIPCICSEDHISSECPSCF